jgi:hypothetical protein
MATSLRSIVCNGSLVLGDELAYERVTNGTFWPTPTPTSGCASLRIFNVAQAVAAGIDVDGRATARASLSSAASHNANLAASAAAADPIDVGPHCRPSRVA